MFSNDVERFLPGAYIQYVRFAGKGRGGDIFIETEKKTEKETITTSENSNTLSENDRKLLQFLSLNPEWQYADFQSAMNLSRAQVGRILKELKTKGYIDRKGSKKTGKWQILKPLSYK